MHSLYFPMSGSHAPVREQPLVAACLQEEQILQLVARRDRKDADRFQGKVMSVQRPSAGSQQVQRTWAFEKGRKEPQQSHRNQKAPSEVGHR